MTDIITPTLTALSIISSILLFFSSLAPPRFVCRLESACLIEGEDIQFTCSTLTTPLPRIRYHKCNQCLLCGLIGHWVCKTHQPLGLAGGLKMAESWLTRKSTASWMMLGVASCVWASSVQHRQILDSMSVRYEIHEADKVSRTFLQYAVNQLFFFGLALEWVWLRQVQGRTLPGLCTTSWHREWATTGLIS